MEETAEKEKTTITIKAHVGSAVNSPERLLWLLEQVKSPAIQVAYDYSHFELQDIDMEESMKLLLPRTKFIHVKDSVGEPGKFQFLLPGWDAAAITALVARAAARGVELKWFGAAEPVAFTSRHDSWRYAPAQSLPQTDRVLAGLIDMRLPLTFMPDDDGNHPRPDADVFINEILTHLFRGLAPDRSLEPCEFVARHLAVPGIAAGDGDLAKARLLHRVAIAGRGGHAEVETFGADIFSHFR